MYDADDGGDDDVVMPPRRDLLHVRTNRRFFGISSHKQCCLYINMYIYIYIYIYMCVCVCVCVCVTGVAGEARAQRAVKMASSHISASAR